MSMQEKLKDNSAINVDIQTIANMIVSLTLTQLTVKLARIVNVTLSYLTRIIPVHLDFKDFKDHNFF